MQYGNKELNIQRRGYNAIISIFPTSQLTKINPKYNGFYIKKGLLYFYKKGGN